MHIEQEHRYYVVALGPDILNAAKKVEIIQGYFEPATPDCTLRIRIESWFGQKGEVHERAFVTIKKGKGLARPENPRNIKLRLAKFMLSAASCFIEKTRYVPKQESPEEEWVIDYFKPPLTNLVLAEVEVKIAARKIVYPDWLWQAPEVTDFISGFDLAKIAKRLRESGSELGKGETIFSNELVDGMMGKGSSRVNEFVGNLRK